jgi:ElaB/YqjD/DUF883 family membrane-anchored ribosome-binding protein
MNPKPISLIRNAMKEQFKELFDAVDELLKRVADAESAEILKIRAKVRIALAGARDALEVGADQGRQPAQRSGAADEFDPAHQDPWQVPTVALLLGLSMMSLFGRRQ